MIHVYCGLMNGLHTAICNCYMNLLYALTNCALARRAPSICVFWDQKQQPGNSTNAWDQNAQEMEPNCMADDNYHLIEQITNVT